MRSEDIAGAVDDLKLRTEIKALVWDGARGHRGEAVQKVGLSTIIQPAYIPELNPVERVFEEVRRWVEGRIYGSVEEKKVWGRRGVKVIQHVQLSYRWRYLFLVVDGRRGRLFWTWMDSRSARR